MKIELITMPSVSTPPRGHILFIHGVYHAAWCWEYFTPYFAENGFACHAMSLRGHGASEGNRFLSKTRFRDYLDDVIDTINRLDENTILVGHSLGGMLIQKYIEDHRVAAAVLISTPTAKSLRTASLRLAREYPKKVFKMILTLNPDHLYKDPKIIKALFFSPDISKEDFKRYLNYLTNQNESRRIFFDVTFLKFRRPEHLVPILVIGEGQDHSLDLGTFQDIASIYATSPVVFDSMPHDMMLEKGWQTVADRILAWLKEQGI